MATFWPKQKEIKRDWHLIDAKERILGRLASEIAVFLVGKNKPCFSPHLDCGDYAVVINAEKVRLTGRKEKEKKYYRHSGYPGGLKIETPKDLREKAPEEILKRAVLGMLPKNRLTKERIKRLKAVVGERNPFAEKFKQK